jgi:hypothetical protein
VTRLDKGAIREWAEEVRDRGGMRSDHAEDVADAALALLDALEATEAERDRLRDNLVPGGAVTELGEQTKDAVRARLAVATPGPWSFGGIGVASLDRRIAMTCLESEEHLRNQDLIGYGAVRDQDVANGEFIAHAPTDVADLLDALEAVETLADQWDDMLRTESEVMTTAQRNAWSFAVTELRAALAGGTRP